jgi:pyruvate formate lyase activating enzyme
MQEALYYQKLDGNKVRCGLCPFNCLINDGKAGVCGVRINQGGVLRSKIYNRATSVGIDPIEKKPLYHFHPGSSILSIGTAGCNFHCAFCQNWEISQNPDAAVRDISPEALLETAKKEGSLGIAYTYSEPSIWIETVLETSRLFHKHGLKNVLVTNGYINPEPLRDLLPFIDAMNIDVKAFKEEFYTKYCAGKLKPVLENVEFLQGKTHIELTMLIIPTLNDDLKEVEKFVSWVSSMDKSMPVHFSRYHPQYKMTIPPTPEETLVRIYEFAREKLDNVYVGNIRIPGAENTYCSSCGNLLIERAWMSASVTGLDGTKCKKCGTVAKNLIV